MQLAVTYAREAGVLRIMLAMLAIAVIASAPFAGDHAITEGWAMIPTVVVPATVPIVFFVLWLDALMAAVFRADAVDDEVRRVRFGNIVKADIILVSVLTLSWLPYFYSVLAV
ncbi:MAG: hypothetical protein OEZ10_04875 [Gammaproteobacteria bacterium]|nr:hypothetical protein [Gammaproteobacteria bacterium]